MTLDMTRARQLLVNGDLRALFVEELGWDRHSVGLQVSVGKSSYSLSALAHKRGMVAYQLTAASGSAIPDYAERRKIEHQVAKSTHEHLVVFADSRGEIQVWQWVKREPGKPAASREHTFYRSQPGDALLQKIQAIAFTLEEEERLSLTDVTSRTRAGFDVERVTKRFFDRFQEEHATFLTFITGITELADREWYASVMLNRLMFVYFIQRKGFLDGDRDYLRNRLARMRNEHGKDKFYSFYSYFLLRLFHEALGGRQRTPELEKLVGRIPYLNGGIFDVHELERPERYGKAIQIPDNAFEKIFDYFDQYQWHLDERPLRADNEINPDVLGYIFEKYINQKQMGAYYTKEDITEYISKNSVLPFLLDTARAKCKVAFENSRGPTVWDLLTSNPDRYIYPANRHGAVEELPISIVAGVNPPTLHKRVENNSVKTLELRGSWNYSAPSTHALPGETWRDVVVRRNCYEATKSKILAREVREVSNLITLNLDIRQFIQDAIDGCEGPDLLRAFWHAIEKVSILDPTCGSGAFLFAALNILEPLYEACLNRMDAFIRDQERLGQKHDSDKYSDFRKVLARVGAHPNRRYFIFKSIILNNLFGVDIMEEAVEICKLRLFLKLAAQIEPDTSRDNLGVEPLPDIDFNIRTGNTLIGYATQDEVARAFSGKFDFDDTVENISVKAAALQNTFDAFRARQVDDDKSLQSGSKRDLQERLNALKDELNHSLASEYGIAASKKDAYRKWLTSHQPFHWFIEFYGIVQERGGFDVIIGNPPYLEYSKVDSYRVNGYRTEKCGNLYAFTVERSLSLVRNVGRLGMIIPISVACSGALQPLRECLTQTARSLWLSHFSNRPGQLFNGAQNRLTIVITSGATNAPITFSTRYHRWDTRSGERDALLPGMRYQDTSIDTPMFHGLLPKVGCAQAASFLTKIRSRHSIAEFVSRNGRYKIYWVRVPGYFCVFLVDPPMARPESGGEARIRGEVNEIAFDSKSDRDVIYAVLNSAAYLQFFCAFSDTRHINPSDVLDFPFDLGGLSAITRRNLGRAATNLSRCYVTNTTQWRKSGLLIDSVDAKPCKPQIDLIDSELARHYDLTEEELDFIVNYDIKYRMGGADEDE